MAAMSRKRLAQVDRFRTDFEAMEAVYNQAIQELEVGAHLRDVSFAGKSEPVSYRFTQACLQFIAL